MNLELIAKQVFEKEKRALGKLNQFFPKRFKEVCLAIFKTKGTVLLGGMGKSGIVARKWASTFSSTGTKSYYLHAADASHGDLGVMHRGDLLILLSNSGETEELHAIVEHAHYLSVPVVVVTQNSESTLAKKAHFTLLIPEVEEACPFNAAPTTSALLMMALGDALAVALMKLKGFTKQDFALNHPGGSLGRRLHLKVHHLMHQGEILPLVTETLELSQVLVTMSQKRLGLAIVIGKEKSQVRGLITDGDVRRFFEKKGWGNPAVARDLMTKRPISISSDALAVEALKKMEDNKIQHLLAFDRKNRLQGVVHLHDLLKAKLL